MRLAAFLVMCALAVVSVMEGRPVLGIAFGGAKAILIGVGYMELGHAARVHMAAFIGAMLALSGLLALMMR